MLRPCFALDPSAQQASPGPEPPTSALKHRAGALPSDERSEVTRTRSVAHGLKLHFQVSPSSRLEATDQFRSGLSEAAHELIELACAQVLDAK